jgi:hypothetical protein
MKPHEKLVAALRAAGAPQYMINKAAEGYYGDFTSPLASPITQLVEDAFALELNDIARRAMDGEFDG